VTGLTSPVFDFQLVRHGTPPKALKRRTPMTNKCNNPDYLNRQRMMLSMPMHWIPKEYLKENHSFVTTHAAVLPVVFRRALLMDAVSNQEMTLKEASEKEFYYRLNESFRYFNFLSFVDANPKGWLYRQYNWLCLDRYKGFNHTWEQEAGCFWNQCLSKRPKSFNKILGGS